MHNPPCETWESHVEAAYAALKDGDDYSLLEFTDFLMHSWDNERLAADPEFVPGGRIYWPLKWDDIKRAKGAA